MSKQYTESQLRQLMLVARQRRAIAELEHEYVSLAQEDGALVYVNEAYSRLFDCAPDQLVGLNLYALMPPEEREAVRTRVELALRGEAVIDSANPVLDGAGRMVWIAWHNSLQIGPAGERWLHSVGRDIGLGNPAARSMAYQSAVLNTLLEATPALVVVFDRQTSCRMVNHAFERWIGLPREQLIGHRIAGLFGAEEHEHFRPFIERALAGEFTNFERDIAVPDKGRCFLNVSFAPLRQTDGTVDGLVCVAQDITELRDDQLRLQNLTRRDPLTGLLNRAGFNRVLAAKCDEGEARSLAVLYVDVDHFQQANAQHGHETCDELLRQLARRLQGLVRPSDAVARLGGDEFAVALTHVRELAHARVVAEKVIAAAQQTFELRAPPTPVSIRIGVSVGVALDAGEHEDWAGLIERASARVHVAKARGRGGWA